MVFIFNVLHHWDASAASPKPQCLMVLRPVDPNLCVKDQKKACSMAGFPTSEFNQLGLAQVKLE
jgi:hypothetical protein